MHFEHSGYRKVINSTDIKKLILQPFRSVKIDTVSYSSHQNPTRTRWDWVREKKVQFFYLWLRFLTQYFKAIYKGFWISAKKQKNFFFNWIFWSYLMLSNHEFFSRSGLCSISWDFFFKMIEQKLTKIQRPIPPSQNPCFGGGVWRLSPWFFW